MPVPPPLRPGACVSTPSSLVSIVPQACYARGPMKRVLCEALPSAGKPSRLPDAEAHHLLRVLRLEDGERVEALDGSGCSVVARLSVRSSGEAWLEFDGGERKSLPADAAQVVLELA